MCEGKDSSSHHRDLQVCINNQQNETTNINSGIGLWLWRLS